MLGYGLTHIVTNHMIVATKDGAVGKHRLLTVGVCGYPHLMELQGGYEDEYVKTKDGWRFKRQFDRRTILRAAVGGVGALCLPHSAALSQPAAAATLEVTSLVKRCSWSRRRLQRGGRQRFR